MKPRKFILLMYAISSICLILISCSTSVGPVNSIIEKQVTVEIISSHDAPATVDSTLCYVKQFVEWNRDTSSGLLDTTKADSLAKWFTQSQYKITDMWFPDVYSLCQNPINTENVVTLKLVSPDASLLSEGYKPTTTVVNNCYPYYRHYIFTEAIFGAKASQSPQSGTVKLLH